MWLSECSLRSYRSWEAELIKVFIILVWFPSVSAITRLSEYSLSNSSLIIFMSSSLRVPKSFFEIDPMACKIPLLLRANPSICYRVLISSSSRYTRHLSAFSSHSSAHPAQSVSFVTGLTNLLESLIYTCRVDSYDQIPRIVAQLSGSQVLCI